MVKEKDLPQKWKKSDKSIRAVQIAFELNANISDTIRDEAGRNGLSASDQIRKIIGLSFKPPKRPRLTITLSPEDYEILASRYQISAADKNKIRQTIRNELVDFSETQEEVLDKK